MLNETKDSKSQRSIDFNSRPAVSFAGSLGYRFDQFRAAVTSNFSKIRVKNVNFKPANSSATKFTNSSNTNGNLKNFMLNGYYDYALDGPVKFVFGIGAGYGRINMDYFYLRANAVNTPPRSRFTRTYNVFIYNAILGFHLILNHMWDMSLEYRYHSTFSQKIGLASNNNFFESDFNFHTLELGLVLKIN
ncbi:MAG: outer membrane beta-barrel protein [Legionellales bacterium]|nr:outer membrane beta-barrel protein [Legionellales bacterium]